MDNNGFAGSTWVVVKIMVPLWIPIIIRHLRFEGTQKGTRIVTTTHSNTNLLDFDFDRGDQRALLHFRLKVASVTSRRGFKYEALSPNLKPCMGPCPKSPGPYNPETPDHKPLTLYASTAEECFIGG